MSSQATLETFEAYKPAPEPDSEPAEWTPGGTTVEQDRCQNCGRPVSSRLRRVSGDNDDVAHACFGCTPDCHVVNGAAADPAYVPRVSGGDH